jgi:predicted CopG family antitoxin
MIMQVKKNHISICISRENYDKMLNMGDMTTSFNDILTHLLEMASLNELKEMNKNGK